MIYVCFVTGLVVLFEIMSLHLFVLIRSDYHNVEIKIIYSYLLIFLFFKFVTEPSVAIPVS